MLCMQAIISSRTMFEVAMIGGGVCARFYNSYVVHEGGNILHLGWGSALHNNHNNDVVVLQVDRNRAIE